MWLLLLNFIFGLAFGFSHKGKEDYTSLLRNGAIAGIVLGIIFVLVSVFLVPGGTGIDLSSLGVLGIFIEIAIFVVIFILGTFIGDRLEAFLKK